MVAAGLILTVTLAPTAGSPADAYVLIGSGCRWPVEATSRTLNTWYAPEADGEQGYAAVGAAYEWRQPAHEGPALYAGSGAPSNSDHQRLHIFGSSVSVNSGYMSTNGPYEVDPWHMPGCSSDGWTSRPNIWLNGDKITERANAGLRRHNIGTAAHEQGHALGLHHEGGLSTPCSSVVLMNAATSRGIACDRWKPTSDEVNGVNKIYS